MQIWNAFTSRATDRIDNYSETGQVSSGGGNWYGTRGGGTMSWNLGTIYNYDGSIDYGRPSSEVIDAWFDSGYYEAGIPFSNFQNLVSEDGKPIQMSMYTATTENGKTVLTHFMYDYEVPTVKVASSSGGGGLSTPDATAGLSFLAGAFSIELGNKLRPFRPITLNNGSLLRQGSIARNLNSSALMSGSRYLQTARGALYWTGAGAGVFGMGLSTYNYINGDISGARYGADLFFGVVSFMGPAGLMVSTTYYIVSSPAFIESSMNYQKQLQENKAKYGAQLNFMERGILCFTKGTNVTMGNGGLKPIESVMIGDTVFTYDFAKEIAIKTEVLRIDAPMHRNLIQISFSNKTLNTNTQDHPYFVIGKGWCSFNPMQSTERYHLTTSKLEIGDKCFVYRKGKLKKVKITSIVQQEGIVKTYNLTGLKVGNSYFANGVLVNNENKTQNIITEESNRKNKKD